MAPRGRSCRQTLEVDGTVSPRLDPVKHPDVFDPFKRNAHSNLPEDSGINTTQGQEDAKYLAYMEHKVTGFLAGL